MKRIVNVDMEVRTNNIEKALSKFFNKYPELDYWKDTFEYMAENNEDFFNDTTMGDGTRNENWAYALHLDVEENHIYIAVVERA